MLKDGPLVPATRASRCADSVPGGARPVLGPHSRNRVWNHVNVDGVAAIGPQLSVPVTLEIEPRRYATTLIGLIPETTMRSLAGSDGRTIPLDPGGVILGTALQDTLAVGVGDTVSVALETGVSNGVGIGGNGTRVADLRVIGFDNEPLGSVAYASLSTV